MTKTQTIAAIKALGLKVSCVDGEYRIAPVGLTAENEERKAAYTDDAEDALGTAQAIAAQMAALSPTPTADIAYDALNDAQDLFTPISDELVTARKAFARSRSKVRFDRFVTASQAFDDGLSRIGILRIAYEDALADDAQLAANRAAKAAAALSPSFSF